ncbi:complement component C1q receptor [Labrus mixtus]|uniref:complement component C1q receptor n=1 Tax=Labrus mixtus TaxID=508554 RepID=UPI0029C02312|nr:complement component C1q receptor [Labrus mixtus]
MLKAIMLLVFVLQLMRSFEGLSGAEHETLCGSDVCFTLNMDRVNFEMAKQSCVHNGGYLMTIRDKEEEDMLRSLLLQVERRQDRIPTFWIGLKLRRGDCVLADKTLKGFKWISGKEESHYSNWEREPVPTCTEERCVSIHYSSLGQKHLKWTDGACRSPAFYVCKFYFKGMCKPLDAGLGQITYTAPFSTEPQRSEMQLLPLGTYAEIKCSDQQSHISMCKDQIYGWTVAGPFCKTGKRNCMINNGECEHLCRQDAGEVQCSCKEGYNLDKDGLTCSMKDLCSVDTCEHHCVMGESGYSCKCQDGFIVNVNQHNCSDIDECQSQICEHHVCINSPGSYTCLCKEGYKMVQGFHTETNGSTCVPDITKTSTASSGNQTVTKEHFTDVLTSPTDEPQHQYHHTKTPFSGLVNVTYSDQQSNTSLVTSLSKTVYSRVIICVLGSLIPLLLLVAMTVAIAIFRCSHSQKEAKKNTTTDGYCWVSSGFDPRLEKLYESILTDDL